MTDKHVKSKKRIDELGEVYTPSWCADQMIALVDSVRELDSRVLEPTAGNGNIVLQVLRRKLIAWPPGKVPDGWLGHFACRAVASVYAIDIDDENVEECRQRVRDVCHGWARWHEGHIEDYWVPSLELVISENIIKGDTVDGLDDIVLPVWKWVDWVPTVGRYEPLIDYSAGNSNDDTPSRR